MATESSREIRRKRILDRGSDRLAFITGQVRSPPPSAVSTPAPAPPPKLGGGEVEEPLPSAVRPARCDVTSGYELPAYEPSSTSVTDTIHRSIEAGKSIESVTAIQPNSGQIQPATVHGSSHNQVANIEPQRARRQLLLLHEMFTAKRISSSVAASENIRVLCATLVALMAVLSYHGLPLGISGSIVISFRPICLVFLTDVTLVVGMLFTTTKWEEKNETDAAAGPESGGDWTDQIGTALETALASQKVATALFLDCSLCAVIIVCGAAFNTQKT